MEQEVFLLLDQVENLVEIPMRQRWQAVMVFGADRAFSVEEAHEDT
jgi:hypothetical protein